MEDNYSPTLISCKNLKPQFEKLQELKINTDNFTLGRGLTNNIVIPVLSISRNHCKFRKMNDEDWLIEDCSSCGIILNNQKLGKGTTRKLFHNDIIKLEPTDEFMYKFVYEANNVFESPRKRIKLEHDESKDIINNVKMKFEESQSFEMKFIEDKINNAKQMQKTSIILKQQLQLDMDRKIQSLQKEFDMQIESLNGEKNEVERQKALLIEERDAQLLAVKEEMEGKIEILMDQIKRHNETETDLLNENALLKQKLELEKERFLEDLNRESSSKKDMLEALEAKMREQDEIMRREKKELCERLERETEQLKLAKEKELKELEEAKQLREKELVQELDNMKKSLEEKFEQTEQQRQKVEQELNEKMETMKKLSDEEKVKMEQLLQEREEIQKKLAVAQENSEKSLEELRKRVSERETELAALAAERIQKQADQSSEVINSLQEQLEKVKNQLQSVETEKNTLLESISAPVLGEGTSKESTLAEVGELMESELQCSVCAELFVCSTTLNCSHTFCKYCITMWKKKKKDCPICRAPITSECKSLVLDSFIEKMVQNLTEEMKQKRQEMLKNREELESELVRQRVGTSRGGDSYVESGDEDSDAEHEEGSLEEEEYDESDDWYGRGGWHRRRFPGYNDDDSGSDYDSEYERYETEVFVSSLGTDRRRANSNTAAAGAGADDAAAGQSGDISNSEELGGSGSGSNPGSRGRVPGRPGSYYGGYGRCFNCGARGHWAPGCPLR